MKSLKEQVKDLKSQRKRDYDPEDEPIANQSNESGSEDEAVPNGGREHYESVSKSKLRKPESQSLGKKYQGIAVSREALEQAGEDDDPFAPVDDEQDHDDPFAKVSDPDSQTGSNASDDESTPVDEPNDAAGDTPEGEADQDSEIDSDEAFEEGDEEKFKEFTFRDSKKLDGRQNSDLDIEDEDEDQGDASIDSEDEEDDDLDMNSDEEMDDGLDDLSSEDGLSDASGELSDQVSAAPARTLPTKTKPANTPDLTNLSRSTDIAVVASALSEGIATDVRKGIAVKQQYHAFDKILDARIKLQKGLSASNDLPKEVITDEDAKAAIHKAEEAALSLWSTIDSIRRGFLDHSQSTITNSSSLPKKRKTPPTPTSSTTSSELWQRSSNLETSVLPYRRAILNKWSRQTRATAPQPTTKSTLLASAPEPTFTSILDNYLSSQSSQTPISSEFHYDDSKFYQSLLVDLISTRSALDASTTDPSSLTTPAGVIRLHPSGSKNKAVDTKASKGRKVRYTVHEKLENFMAPEDRTTWGDAARTEFFGSLFGQRNLLAENGGLLDWDGGDVDGEEGGEGEALRLFRS